MTGAAAYHRKRPDTLTAPAAVPGCACAGASGVHRTFCTASMRSKLLCSATFTSTAHLSLSLVLRGFPPLAQELETLA